MTVYLGVRCGVPYLEGCSKNGDCFLGAGASRVAMFGRGYNPPPPSISLRHSLRKKVIKKSALAAWILGIKIGSQNPGGYIPPSGLQRQP